MRILLVEDNPGDVRLIEVMVRDAGRIGLELQSVGRLAEALDRLAREPFDAVLLDLSLPDSQGLDTVTRVRRSDPDMPIVVLTSLDDEQVSMRTLNVGAQDYLVKGRMDGALLVRSVKYAIERQRALAALGRAAQLEKELQQAQKMEAIGQLAGGVAHDFNNILGGIMGYAELLRKRLVDSPNLGRYAKGIVDASLRAADLVQKLLAFARRANIAMTPVDVNEVVRQSADIFKHTLDGTIRIATSLRAHPSVVLGDMSQIGNILLNLGVNARDAMPDGGTLTLETETVCVHAAGATGHPPSVPAGKYVRISIADSGVGVDKKILPHIFEPFFTTKGVGKGTGLGLASVYGSVRQHNGYLDVQSEPGKGATFAVYLPVNRDAPPLPALADDDGQESEPAGGGTILVVDDEESIREFVSDALTDLGYRVSCCTNGNECIEHYKANGGDTDLVILDMTMPGLGGAECFRRLAQIDPSVAVVIASGHGKSPEADDLVAEGVRAVMSKPFKIPELTRVVAGVMRNRRS